MQFPSLRRVLRLAPSSQWLLLPICLLAVDAASAQSTDRTAAREQAAQQPAPQPKPPTPTPTTKPTRPVQPTTPDPRDWIYLPGPDGKRIPLPADLWKDFLRWQAGQQAPPFHVTSVTLDGRVDRDRALLEAMVEVQVQSENQWVPIVLRMKTGNTVRTP